MLKQIVKTDKLNILNKWSLSNPTRLYADIEGKDVFNPCDGVVMFIGRDTENYYSVLIQICADVVVNFKHLVDIDVSVGQLVRSDEHIGRCRKFCRVELGTLTRDETDECIRIYDKMYYKRNPEHLTYENLGFVQFNHGETEYAYRDSELSFINNFTKEQEKEYSQIEVQQADE